MNVGAPRPLNVNLRQLRAFVAIGRLGSFTRAAVLLHTTQPALSARIRELEDALAVRLFDRNTRSVRLTGAGEDLLPVVEQVMQDLGSVVERARDVAARTTGRIAIAALPSMCAELLPASMARFKSRYPGVSITLRDALGDRVVELVRTREVDFGVSSIGSAEPAFELTALGSDRIVALLPRKHPLAARRRISLAALVEHPLILMDRDSSVRHLVDATCAALGRMPAPMHEPTFMATAVALVRAGEGVTLLPSSAHEVRTASSLAVREIDHPGLQRTIGVLRLKDRSFSPAASAFVDVLVDEARGRLGRPPSQRSRAKHPLPTRDRGSFTR